MPCLTNIGFVQCFSFGSRKASYTLLLRFSHDFVLRVLPHKHRGQVCAVLFPCLPESLLHAPCRILLYSVIFCFACLTNIGFVQCSSFRSRSLLHSFGFSNLCFALFATPTSGLCSAFPFSSLKFTPFCFSFCYSVYFVRLCVLCPTSFGLCSDFSRAPLEFARVIFCFVLFSFNFVFCVLSVTNFIFLRFLLSWFITFVAFVLYLVNLFGVFYFTLFTVVLFPRSL